MSDVLAKPVSAFQAQRMLASGPLHEVALAIRERVSSANAAPVLVFDDASGRVIDLDLRGSEAEILQRLSAAPQAAAGRYRRGAEQGTKDAEQGTTDAEEGAQPRGRGRPKLGVVAREVTLLPRQWEWLAGQPGGASAVLRRLVDEARRRPDLRQQRRQAQEAAYQVMLALGGDLPGYEEATRALFADDLPGLHQQLQHWPEDIRVYALRLAAGAGQ